MNKLVTMSLVSQDVGYLLPFRRTLLNKIELSWLDWIGAYVTKYGKPPTLERFEKEFSENFSAVTSPDPLQDIFEQTFVEKRNLYVRTTISKHATELKEGADPMPIVQMIYDAIEGVDATCVDSEFWDKSNYYRVQETMKTGFKALDETIGGFVRGDLVFIAGRPGDGKTTFLIHMIAKWYMEGKRILLISNEIPFDDMLFKIDSVLANIKVSEKRLNIWEPESKKKIAFLQYLTRVLPGKIITPKGPVRKPSSVRALIEQHKPDIVCIDGAYLMSPNDAATTEWGELAVVSRELKQIANQKQVAIVGVLQANRDSENRGSTSLSAIAGTDAYGQDADIVLLLKAQGFDGGDKQVLMHTSKNRHGVFSTIELRYDFARNVIYEDK